jgi:hypothetical protein
MAKKHSEMLQNIPKELREPAAWLQYYLTTDPNKPDKKPTKHPTVKYRTTEDKKANLRSLDQLLKREPTSGGVQRLVDPLEGFVFIDIDKVRNPETGEVEPWAQELIDSLDTYTEISASGRGFHLVCRGVVPRDFHTDPDQVEIYAGHTPNKLIAMTGEVYEFHCTIEKRQRELDELFKRAAAREFNKKEPQKPSPYAPAEPERSWRDVFHTLSELSDEPARVFIKGILEEGITVIGSMSGVGKTWVGLSISRALLSGEPLFGHFPVITRANVLYFALR